MSYPPNKNTEHSLPSKPAAPYGSSSNGAGRGAASIASMNFKPRSVGGGASAQHGQSSYSAAPGTGHGNPSYGGQQSGGQGYYGQQQSAGGYYAPGAQITNPFSAPGTSTPAGGGSGAGRGFNNAAYDPEYEAQIAQWQSAYAAKDESKPSSGGSTQPVASALPGPRPQGNIDIGNVSAPTSGVAAVVSGADGKQQTVVRSGGGKTWQDSSLLEWDPAHPRLFIGNLAGEVTDESLHKAFAAYPSLQRARVIREKRTSKSKGYGFVSFGNSDDYFQAAKEMNGKYIGSHPVLIKRSTTEIKATKPGQGGHRGGRHAKGGNRQDVTRADTGAGVNKKGPKKKGGLKFLG